MYLCNLQIRDLKLIRELDLPFRRADGSLRLWTVLVGENGLGKTSILRAAALVAVGPERGNQLADVASLPDRRKTKPHLHVTAELAVPGPNGSRSLLSTVELPHGINLFRGSSRWSDAPSEPTNGGGPLAEAQAKRDPGPDCLLRDTGLSDSFRSP